MKTTARIIFAVIVFSQSFAFADSKMLDVPFISQVPPGDWTQTRNCGPVSVLMVAGYYQNFMPSVENIIDMDDWLYDNDVIYPQYGIDRYNGNYTSITDLAYLFSDYFDLGPTEKVYPASKEQYIIDQIDRGNPVIVAVRINLKSYGPGHFMVVIGYDDSGVIIHDPGHSAGNGGLAKHYSYDQLLASWATWNYAALHVKRFTTWHPNGTLIKSHHYPEVFMLIDGTKHWIVDWSTFLAHDYDSSRIIEVISEELDCYADSWPVDWRPYRELFSNEANGQYYMLEKMDASHSGCMIYEFATNAAVESWSYLSEDIEVLSSNAAQDKINSCSYGGQLNLRDGSLIKPEPPLYDMGFGEGAVFVIHDNGVASAFENFGVFEQMKYDSSNIIILDRSEFLASIAGIGENIITEDLRQCNQGDMGTAAQCLAGTVENSYSGLFATIGIGLCQAEQKMCFGNEWYIVQNQILPSVELEDGLDNDCDGSVDEDFVQVEEPDPPEPEYECENDQTFDSYSGPLETYGIGICRPQINVCVNGFWQTVQTQVLPQPEQNDGLDNDCDGLVDDGFNQYPDPPDPEEECIENEMQTTYSGLPQTYGVGICRPQILACVNGFWDLVQFEVLPQIEIEDNLDNDCDGLVDEGFEAPEPDLPDPEPSICDDGEIYNLYTGPEGTLGIGICQHYVMICMNNNWDIIQQQVLPQPEQNDGLDNDCDGLVDDGFNQYPDPPDPEEECIENEMQTTYSGLPQTYGVGICRPQIMACVNGFWELIQFEILPGPELEDGLDNDCDGLVDEDFAEPDPEPDPQPGSYPWAAKVCPNGDNCIAFSSYYLAGQPSIAKVVGDFTNINWDLASGIIMIKNNTDNYYYFHFPDEALPGIYRVSYRDLNGAWAQYGDNNYDEVGPFRWCGFDGNEHTCSIRFELMQDGSVEPRGENFSL